MPEKLYVEKCSENSFTMYFVDGYSGRTDELGEQLKQIGQKYSVIVQDNISESSAAKDSLTIQYISIATGIIMLALMGIVSVYVIMKVDYIARIRTYVTYRTLGMERRQAVMLQFTEQMLSLVNAVLLSVVVVVLNYSIMCGIMVYYDIILSEVVSFMIITTLLVIMLMLWNAARMSGERYRYKIGDISRD